jgi:hypothetical protein
VIILMCACAAAGARNWHIGMELGHIRFDDHAPQSCTRYHGFGAATFARRVRGS